MTAPLYAIVTGFGLVAGSVGITGVLGLTWTLRVGAIVPLGGLALEMDPLAGLFLALVGFSVAASSCYAVGYVTARRGAGAYVAFALALGVVPLAANAMTFLLAWEVMSLASWALVLDGRDDVPSRRAAWVYAVMTHAGLACLLAGMLLLASHTGTLHFADWRAASPTLPAGLRNAVWFLLAVGFASKAGVIPLHVWLPLAHSAAPSHVSALMSGVMIKLGVYGLLRAGLEWLAPGPAWWGGALLILGALSAVVGILYALVDADLKRLLAFSSIDNVGVILIGVGGALLFVRAEAESLAALALIAALYHTINHAAFKTLLFLGAGAVVHATRTRSMEAYGGLIKRMPWTAACFLAGAVSISALPPLNGFVSEWLTFQALLQSVRVAQPGVSLIFALGTAALALTAGLTAACFVKAFGITFLALPRSDAAEHAHDATVSMRLAMAALAVACVALGLGATVIVPALANVAASVLGAPSEPTHVAALTFSVVGGFASLSPVIVAAGLVAGLVAPVVFLVAAGSPRRARAGETWGCGRIVQTPRMEYTAGAFSDPYKRVFRFFYRPVKRIDLEVHPESRFFVRRMEYANPARALFDEWLYRPVLRGMRALAGYAQALQSGNAAAYLGYILAALLALLVLR